MKFLLAAAISCAAFPAFAQDHAGHEMADADAMPSMSQLMRGAYGSYYPMTREASGTAWQPDSSEHAGAHAMHGDWMLMGHVELNGVYDTQAGPRGDDKAFVSGMVMGMAKRSLGAGTLQFRGMLSPDPLMGKDGYPLLLAAGESADGVTPLVDRQHPHELVMELSASLSAPVGDKASVFVYGGLPGEPAFGPPSFMHRMSIADSPEAPISHHWLDSTHIVFGVVTAGITAGNWKLDASRFRGREPDENRWDIETGALDSSAARLSWNPTREVSLQGSWAQVKSPEALHPEDDQTKWSASAIWTHSLTNGGWWSSTLAWGRRSSEEGWLAAYALESAIHPNLKWTLYGRAERVETNELIGGGHGPVFTVGKVSAGAVRDFQVSERARVGLGAQAAWNFVPNGLEASYGGDKAGAMAFVRLKLE